MRPYCIHFSLAVFTGQLYSPQASVGCSLISLRKEVGIYTRWFCRGESDSLSFHGSEMGPYCLRLEPSFRRCLEICPIMQAVRFMALRSSCCIYFHQTFVRVEWSPWVPEDAICLTISLRCDEKVRSLCAAPCVWSSGRCIPAFFRSSHIVAVAAIQIHA